MPVLQRSGVTIAANGGRVNLASGWQFERIPAAFGMAYLRLLAHASAVGTVMNVFTGSAQVVQDSALSKGEAGEIPTTFQVPLIDWQSEADDLLNIEIANPTNAAVTVDFYLSIEPV